MKPNSIRYASGFLALVLLAACHGSPVPKPVVTSRQDSATPPTTAGAAGGTGATGVAGGSGVGGASGVGVVAKGNSAAVPASAIPPVPERATHQYAQALDAMKAGRASDAELQFRQLAAAYPNLAGPEVNLGLLQLRGGRYADAQTAFDAALERNPDNAVASNGLGIALRHQGKFTQAEAAYRKAIALQPDYARAYLNLGVLYDLYLVEPQKALEQYERFLTLAGDNKQVSGWVIELKKRVGAPAAPASAPQPKKEPA